MDGIVDRLKQLESFAAVATKGSLTAAASAEGVAPAVIGRRIDALEQRLGVKLHHTTPDNRVTLEPIYCLGNCACGPALLVDHDDLHANVTPARFDALLAQWREAVP